MRVWLCPLALGLLLGTTACSSNRPASSGTTEFVLDGNRIYARLAFVLPDGSTRKALAFVDMGSPDFAVPTLLALHGAGHTIAAV